MFSLSTDGIVLFQWMLRYSCNSEEVPRINTHPVPQYAPVPQTFVNNTLVESVGLAVALRWVLTGRWRLPWA